MNDSLKKGENKSLVTTFITLVLGIILAIIPTQSLEIIVRVISILIIVIGGYLLVDYLRSSKDKQTISYSLAIGIIAIVIGLILFLNPSVPAKFVVVVVGILLIIKGIYKLQLSLNIRSLTDKWKYNFLVSLVIITIGILLIIYPYNSISLFLRIIGIILIIESVIEIMESINVQKSANTSFKDNNKEAKEIEFVDKKKK